MIDVNENETNVENEQMDTKNYIEVIKDLKQNTVSKEVYDKVVEDKKMLMNALANGEGYTSEEQPKPTLEDLKKDFMSGDSKTNMECVQNLLALRNAVIEKTGTDPFGYGGEEVADALQYCLDEANGDSDLFNAVGKRILKDPIKPKK